MAKVLMQEMPYAALQLAEYISRRWLPISFGSDVGLTTLRPLRSTFKVVGILAPQVQHPEDPNRVPLWN